MASFRPIMHRPPSTQAPRSLSRTNSGKRPHACVFHRNFVTEKGRHFRRPSFVKIDQRIIRGESSYSLPGESGQDFEAIRRMMIDDIQPKTKIEWLWTLDLIERSWELSAP